MQSRTWILGLLIAASLLGCATAPDRSPTSETLSGDNDFGLVPSGFLSDYSKLARSTAPDTNGAYIYRNRSKSLGLYKMVIIEPVKVHLRPDAAGRKQSPNKLRNLASYFESKLRENLANSFPEVSQPAFGVMRIRAAIVDATPTLPNAKGVEGPPVVGMAAMELEILDSQTGEQLAAAVDSRPGRWHLVKNLTQEDGYTKDLLNQWAVLLRNALDDVRGLRRGRGI